MWFGVSVFQIKTNWHVATAAESLVAAQFARCGWDVSVQYGANQPEYDLVVVKNDQIMKVSVKGSQDRSWGLTQGYLVNADYQVAVDNWQTNHGQKTVFCLVQFKDVSLNEMPRIYLATPHEIAVRLKETANGRGSTILFESHQWTNRAYAAGQIEKIPEEWKFSACRVEEVYASLE